MPIIKTKDTTVIEFGTGDITINSGMIDYNANGLITFNEDEEKEIGLLIKNENPHEPIDNFPVALVFTDVRSIDVLIERLETTKKYMTGELDISKYEF